MRVFITLLMLLSILSVNGQLNGNYTIGGIAPDYPNISSAIVDLNTFGINGNVNFKLRPGTYNERIDLTTINGSSDTSIVTFESESSDTSSVWWISNSSNSSDNYILKCNNISFLSIKNISFRNNGTYGSGVILLENGTSNFEFEGNHIAALAPIYGNYDRHRLITSTNSADSNIFISNNNIELGAYGIHILGANSTARDSNIVITNNTISSTNGIYLKDVERVVLSKNKITSFRESLVISGFGNPLMIDYNDVYSDTENALLIENNSNNDSSSDRTRVHNNFFKARKCGLKAGSVNLDVINNTCYTRYNGYGAVSLVSNVNLFNNIFYCEESVVFRVSTASLIINSNNNLFYAPIAPFVIGTNVFQTLSEWQQFSGQDLNSNFGPTQFASNDDLHVLNSAGAYNKASINAWINEDIDGESRGTLPDIGADEFIQPNVDVGISPDYIIDIEDYVCSGNKVISAKIVNHGLSTLTSAIIQLEVNGVPQVPNSWTGSLSFLDTSSYIDLDYYLPQDTTLNFRVWVSAPNGIIDPFHLPDTLVIAESLQTRMQGIYSIGGLNSDYISIQEAVDDIYLRGTCNNVELRLENGIYTASIDLDNINRATSFDTLFFNSASGNPDSVLWTNTGGYRPLRIFKTNNVYISNISMRLNTTSGSLSNQDIVYVPYSNQTDGNYCFRNCKFSSLNGTQNGLRIYSNNIKVINSQFDGFEYAIHMDNSTLQVKDLLLKNNCFNNQIESAIYLVNAENVIIENNQFSNDFSVSSHRYTELVYINSSLGDFKFCNNRISGLFNSLMNIKFTGTPTNKGEIYNNFFSVKLKNPNGGGYLFVFDTDNLNFYHNSINADYIKNGSLVNNEAMWAVIIVFNPSIHSGNEIFNNTIVADSAYHVFSGLNNVTADYNNVFIPNILNAYETPVTTNHQNSISVDPNYFSFSELYPLNNTLEGMGVDLGLTIDIDSNLRSVPPTIGAVEIWPYTYNLYLNSIYTVPHCDSFDLYCKLENLSPGQIDSVLIILEMDGLFVDSLFFETDFGISNPIDSVYLGTFPIQNGLSQLFNVEAQIKSIIDQFPYNNIKTHQILFNSFQDVNLGPDTMICDYQQIIIDAGFGMDDYHWNTLETTQVISLDGSILGSGIYEYYVTVTDENECMSSDTIIVTIDQCLGIEELDHQKEILLFPNPTKGTFTLELNQLIEDDIKFLIFDAKGAPILNNYKPIEIKSSNSFLFDLELSPGLYFLQIETREWKESRLFVIEK